MSYALDTSKRKFHRILDSISNNTSTSRGTKRSRNGSVTALSHEQTAEQPLSKRLRFTRPPSQTLSLSSAHPPKNMSNINITQPSDKPAFAPWDRSQFLSRLKTFSESVLKWAPKPDNMNEVEWAKRGWSCVDKETVGCSACAKRIVINMKKEDSVAEEEESTASLIDQHTWQWNARKELAARYALMIVSGHYEDCLWRTRGCDASIQRLPTIHRTTAIQALTSRYKSLLKIHESLPSTSTFPKSMDLEMLFKRFLAITLRPSLPSTSDAPERPDQQLDDGAFQPGSADYEVRRRAFGFALIGWNGRPESNLGGNKIVDCSACFRRLGMWLWLPRPRPNGAMLEPCNERMDVAGEHRHYCPWVNGSTQNAGQKLEHGEGMFSGWETLVRSIMNAQELVDNSNVPQSQQGSNLPRPEDDARHPVPSGNDSASEAASVLEDKQNLEVKDKERWAKLKKLKKAFSVKRVKSHGLEKQDRPQVAG